MTAPTFELSKSIKQVPKMPAWLMSFAAIAKPDSAILGSNSRSLHSLFGGAVVAAFQFKNGSRKLPLRSIAATSA